MQRLLLISFLFLSLTLFGQNNTSTDKKRLNFAKSYFEVGGTYAPSFTGSAMLNDSKVSFQNAASIAPYINWGGFHFWGHAEFFVSMPLSQINLTKNEETDFSLASSVITGARYLPWAYEEKRITPFIGLNWSGVEFQQSTQPDGDQPFLAKDFLLVPEVGFLFGSKSLALRGSLSYYKNNTWNYPISKTEFAEIETPQFNMNVALVYSFESTEDKEQETNDRWNDFPTVSKLSHGATRFGDFFFGVAPSVSFSLAKYEYNQSNLPYLKDQITSSFYLDYVMGYQFNKAGLFAALSFRNPSFKTKGYDSEQTIKKRSFGLELNKHLTDYTGFVPFIGLNLSYDQFEYSEIVDGVSKKESFSKLEPGVTFGWDILPGKTEKPFLLRTNLRWYPFSSFSIEDKSFDFSQLEYNLIQIVIFPQRFSKKKNRR